MTGEMTEEEMIEGNLSNLISGMTVDGTTEDDLLETIPFD